MSLYLYMESKKRFGPSGAQIFQAAFASGCECVACTATFFCVFFRLSEGFSPGNPVARRRSRPDPRTLIYLDHAEGSDPWLSLFHVGDPGQPRPVNERSVGFTAIPSKVMLDIHAPQRKRVQRALREAAQADQSR